MKNKRILVIIVLLMVCALLTACSTPEGTYKSAQNLLAQSKYAEAAEKFESLGSYEDSSLLAIYCKACALCEQGNYKMGIDSFESLGTYKDCAMRITYYTARSWDDPSVDTTEFEWMQRAKNIYNENPLYLDSSERITALDISIAEAKKTLYDEAVAMAEGGQYDAAITTFKRLDTYRDSAKRISYYGIRKDEDAAVAAFDEDAVQAIAVRYTDMGVYLDCVERSADMVTTVTLILDNKYNAAVEAGNSGDYTTACDAFQKLGQYSDSELRLSYYTIRSYEDSIEPDGWASMIETKALYEELLPYLDCAERIEALDKRIEAAKNAQYNAAVEAGESGDYTTACNAFKKLGQYNDSEMRISYYTVRSYEDSVEPDNWASMIETKALYEELLPYLDCAERIEALDKRIEAAKNAQYNAAVEAGESGDYTTACNAFKKLEEYSDSKLRLSYYTARSYEDSAQPDNWVSMLKAQSLYEELLSYLDCEERVTGIETRVEAAYNAAADAEKNYDYNTAYYSFIALGTYKDSASRAEFIQYTMAIAFGFENASSFSEGFACVKKDGKYGYVDAKGNIIIKPQWNDASSFNEELARVKKNGKYGFIDTKGDTVIKFQWDYAGSFSEGLACVKKNGKYGFIDAKGNIVIEPQWDAAGNFSEGSAYVRKNLKYGFIDTKGNVVIKPQWDNAWSFSEGLACVKKNGKYGFIDAKGNIVIKPQWDEAGNFSEGLAFVKKDGKYGYINTKGNIVIKPRWDNAWGFSEELARVLKGDKYGFIDTKGNIVIEPLWNEVRDFSEGMACIKKNGKWGYIDKKDNIVIEPLWNDAESFSEGLAAVKKDGKWEYIDTKGNIIIGFGYLNGIQVTTP